MKQEKTKARVRKEKPVKGKLVGKSVSEATPQASRSNKQPVQYGKIPYGTDMYTAEVVDDILSNGIKESAEAAVKYSLLTTQISLSTVSAPNDTAEATLVDHAINIVDLPASIETITFTFPPVIQGKARDFMIRLTIIGEVPTIYFQEAGGGSITFDADDETWTNIQPGGNLIMFTETKQA